MTIKILCDVHIAMKVVYFFQSKGRIAKYVNDILDGSKTKDSDISDYANEHGFTVVTKDSDFKNSHFIQGKPSKLLKISLGNISTTELIEILELNLDIIVANFQKGKCFIEIGRDYMEVIS